jgi:hypothetical protein
MWCGFYFVLGMFHSHVGIVNSLVKFVQLYDVFVWLCGNIEYLSNWSQIVMWISLWLSMTNFLGILWVGGNQPWWHMYKVDH